MITEARRQSRQVPSIVAHGYRDEPSDDAVSGGKGLRVPGSAGGHDELERMGSLDVPAKVRSSFHFIHLDKSHPVVLIVFFCLNYVL